MMAGLFPEQKYTDAAEKALAFIKRQMDVNNFQFQITFAEPYGDEYNGDVVWGEITGLTPDHDQVFPKYIGTAGYFDFAFTGKVSGTWHDVPDYANCAVNVYVIHDATYKVITCPLKPDGTWESVMEYRETYTVPIIDEATGEPTGQTREEVITYTLDFPVGEGIKEFRLARNLTSHWEQLPPTVEGMTAERLVYDAADEVSAED